MNDNTSSEGTGGRNSDISKEAGSGESFTNTSESCSGSGSNGSMGDYKLGGSKFN